MRHSSPEDQRTEERVAVCIHEGQNRPLEITPAQPRRGMLRWLCGAAAGVGFAALAATHGLWAAMTARFLLPNASAEPPRRLKAGPADYCEGRVETKFGSSGGVWIVHGTYRGARQIYALRTVCTHLGCITRWDAGEQAFQCPCHGSRFSREGINLAGPAPRPLERCAIRVADDGQVEIDRGRVFREELGQWNDRESYVEA
jgi:cytochrome b6-f complex iron-sulfur subunit